MAAALVAGAVFRTLSLSSFGFASDFDIRFSGLGPAVFRALIVSSFGFVSDFEFRISNFAPDVLLQ